MKTLEINGVTFEIDFNKPNNDVVYCKTYDVIGEPTTIDIIDCGDGGRTVVQHFDVPYWGDISVDIKNEKVYRPIYREVV